MELKMSVSAENLCRNCPAEFQTLLKYAKGLKFEEEPDYVFIKSTLEAVLEANEFRRDDNFDWIENGTTSARRQNVFLHLMNRQQEIARRSSNRRLSGDEGRHLAVPVARSPMNEQNSLVVNYSSHFVDASGEGNSGSKHLGINKSPRNVSPAGSPKGTTKVAEKKKKTTKCSCLVLCQRFL
eukprot:TRINITY_DN9734_c0_g4_i12.p2 TRINITY_DN9734_c0_g4~~TRINITY_DN9734_c0_g4_i12.p2  ORF type:complete len:182 (-),score=27.40 TRINITY_DN9734_c0_g4_i12:151-696(-)